MRKNFGVEKDVFFFHKKGESLSYVVSVGRSWVRGSYFPPKSWKSNYLELRGAVNFGVEKE